MRPQPNAPTPLTLARAALLALVASTVLVLSTARATRADGCKPDGQRCATNVSCCSRTCMKPATPPGKAKPLFGVCGTPTSTTSPTATTTTTTTATTLPSCSGTNVNFLCHCTNGAPCSAFTCTMFPTTCEGARSQCVGGLCPTNGGPGDCSTAPCFDCTTGQQCE